MSEKKTQPRRSGNIKKKRDGLFLVSIFLGRDAKGKRRYVAKQIKGTLKDAQKYLNTALSDKDKDIFVEPSSLTVNEYLTKWLEAAARVSRGARLTAMLACLSDTYAARLGRDA